MVFELPKLDFNYNSFEEFVDAKTMNIHYNKHHKSYIDKLNFALEKYPQFKDKNIIWLLKNLNELPEEIRIAVRNNGGGHFNHSLFWEFLSFEKQEISEDVLELIKKSFENFENFKEKFVECGLARFGSGWIWLVLNKNKLEIISSPNQDNPLMNYDDKIILLCLDVWEHAYYLKYQNDRKAYILKFFDFINWKRVDEIYDKSKRFE
jgi:Fe-Mn family superoxide dismutase